MLKDIVHIGISDILGQDIPQKLRYMIHHRNYRPHRYFRYFGLGYAIKIHISRIHVIYNIYYRNTDFDNIYL